MNDYYQEIGALPEGSEVSVRGYLIGLVLSLAAIAGAYALTLEHELARGPLVAMLIVLALAQFAVQSAYFLHVRASHIATQERFYAFCSFSFIVLCLVVGSLWVMTHLDERMMAPQQQMQYMQMQ